MKLLSLVFLTILVSCSSTKGTQHSTINAHEVKTKLVKGKTTQKEIIDIYGGPDVVDITDHGETWVYTRRSDESSSTSAGASGSFDTAKQWWRYSPVGGYLGGDSSSSTTKTSSLSLEFNKQKILISYNFRSERF